MSWERAPVAAAVAQILAPVDPTVTAYATPPETFNPPAYIVRYVQSGEYDLPSFGIDLVTLLVACVGGPNDPDRVDELRIAARQALEADPQLGGTVQFCKVRGEQSWERWVIAGAESLKVDLLLEIRK